MVSDEARAEAERRWDYRTDRHDAMQNAFVAGAEWAIQADQDAVRLATRALTDVVLMTKGESRLTASQASHVWFIADEALRALTGQSSAVPQGVEDARSG